MKGLCDSHLHVFGDPARYPMDPRRSYTPEGASLASYRAAMVVCGIERAVLVQPSVYGTDNRCMLDVLRQAAQDGGDVFRAVAVPDAASSDDDLDAMHALGVRGIRLNLVNPQVLAVDAGLSLTARMQHRGWHLQLHVSLRHAGATQLAALLPRARRLGVAVVVDHMGRPEPGTLPQQLIAWLADGKVWVKLSAAYRNSAALAPGYDDLAPLVRALVAANPDQLLWGSDWPHTELSGAAPQALDLVQLLDIWAPDVATRHKIAVANPARLYGF